MSDLSHPDNTAAGYSYPNLTAATLAQLDELNPERRDGVLRVSPPPSGYQIKFVRDGETSQLGKFYEHLTGQDTCSPEISRVIEKIEDRLSELFTSITGRNVQSFSGMQFRDKLTKSAIKAMDAYTRDGMLPMLVIIDPYNFDVHRDGGDVLWRMPHYLLQATRICSIASRGDDEYPVDIRTRSTYRRPHEATWLADGNGRSITTQFQEIIDTIGLAGCDGVIITEDIIERGTLVLNLCEELRKKYPEMPITVLTNVSSSHFIQNVPGRNITVEADYIEPLGTICLDTRSQLIFQGRSIGEQTPYERTVPATVSFGDIHLTLTVPYSLDMERYGDIADVESRESRKAMKAFFFESSFQYLDALEGEIGRAVLLKDLASDDYRFDLPVGMGMSLPDIEKRYTAETPLREYLQDLLTQEIYVELVDDLLEMACKLSDRMPDSSRALNSCLVDLVNHPHHREYRSELTKMALFFRSRMTPNNKILTHEDLMPGEERRSLVRGIVQDALQHNPYIDLEVLSSFVKDRAERVVAPSEGIARLESYADPLCFNQFSRFELHALTKPDVTSIEMPALLKSEDAPAFTLELVRPDNLEIVGEILQFCFQEGWGDSIAQTTSRLTFPKSRDDVERFLSDAVEFTHAFYYLVNVDGVPMGLVNARGIKRGEGDLYAGTFGTVVFNPAARGQGIGMQAKEILFEALFEAGIGELHSKVLDSNTKAAEALERMNLKVRDSGLDPDDRPYRTFTITQVEWRSRKSSALAGS